MAFVCFCFGQDEEEYVPESIWVELSDVCGTMVRRKGGSRGQEYLKQILEGKVSLKLDDKVAISGADRKLTRGAVM